MSTAYASDQGLLSTPQLLEQKVDLAAEGWRIGKEPVNAECAKVVIAGRC